MCNTERNLIRRINRVLAKEHQALWVPCGDRFWSDLGNYYIVDLNRNTVVAGHCTPEGIAKELGLVNQA